VRSAPVALTDILEVDWQRTVVDLAKQLGFLTYHTHNSRRSAHGFPDLVLVRDRVIYLELKRETTGPTDQQKAWLRALTTAGAEAYLARPSDLDDLALILSARERVTTNLHERTSRDIAA
jgi:hypothetical protein